MAGQKISEKRRRSGISLLMAAPHEVGAAEFKARCLQIVEEVERSGSEVVITRHRKPVARLVPIRDESGAFCGALTGMVTGQRDVISPIDVKWEYDESNLA
jgi:prevent-host-death family protein